MNGTVTVLDKGAVRIHSYMSPADTFHTTTQLIETPLRVIAIDAQLVPAYADEAVAYAKGLGKPLDRLIVTHAHPDRGPRPRHRGHRRCPLRLRGRLRRRGRR